MYGHTDWDHFLEKKKKCRSFMYLFIRQILTLLTMRVCVQLLACPGRGLGDSRGGERGRDLVIRGVERGEGTCDSRGGEMGRG